MLLPIQPMPSMPGYKPNTAERLSKIFLCIKKTPCFGVSMLNMVIPTGLEPTTPALIKTRPQDDAVYQFLDKKRAQGKPYYVYMTAGANKFLRIYYGRVKEYLLSLS